MADKQALEPKRAELADAARKADDTAFVVEGRVIRRIIREQYAFPRLVVKIPHSKVYCASREQLRREVHADELGLPEKSQMPRRAILIQEPSARQFERLELPQLKLRCWRLLFHGRIDRAMQECVDDERINTRIIRERINRLGQVTFDEIHTVLRREHLLVDDDSPELAWQEFVAIYFEFRYFSPGSVNTWFPSLRDRDLSWLVPEIDADALFEQTRLQGAADPSVEDEFVAGSAPAELAIARAVKPYRRRSRRLLKRADRAAVRENTVAAAISAAAAAEWATDHEVAATTARALNEIDTLVSRLQDALEFDETEAAEWRDALVLVLPHAARGFWNSDRKLLYDLQKVCSDHERLSYKVDLVKWIVSRGRRPIKRPLPNQREVMMSKHLRSAAGRLPFIRLSGPHRERLSSLLRSAAKSAEHQMRNRLRPKVAETLTDVGFVPQNLPERVAFQKVTEQCLDCIVDRGYLTMGYLRDGISRNNLKLPDVRSFREIISGDQLLKADDRFDENLDGVYHRGEFYLRWLQVLSSLAFGTRPGRFTTKFIAIPFGVATMAVVGTDHLIETILDRKLLSVAQQIGGVLALGFLLMALIHLRSFRDAFFSFFRSAFRGFKKACIDLPLRMVQWPPLRALLRSRAMRLTNRFLITPAILTMLLCLLLPGLRVLPEAIDGGRTHGFLTGVLFLLISALLNSRWGRDIEEIAVESVSRLWYALRAHVFVAIFEWVWEAFEKSLEFVERFLYAIDEWLRFRSGESPVTLAVKAVLGVVWSALDFVVRTCVTLFIEPQINPIKHFPVVTVAHKLLLPTLPVILGPVLTPLLGSRAAANGAAGLIATACPGVFGFLVWELKANWRLYQANRADTLRPVAVGNHGETMLRLLKPGFHSGTLPKLHHKLRRLDRKTASFRRSVTRQALYERLHHCEEAITHHVERELFSYLLLTDEWHGECFRVRRVKAASNSIELTLDWDAMPETPLTLVFQEQAGWLVAAVVEPGWAETLNEERRDSFLAALLGFYKVGAVDLSRGQIQHSLLDPQLAYDISRDGLKVWPGDSFRMEFTYDLHRRPTLSPKPASAGRRMGLPDIEASRLILSDAPVSWADWVRFWEQPRQEPADALLDGRVLVTELNGQPAALASPD